MKNYLILKVWEALFFIVAKGVSFFDVSKGEKTE